MAAPALAAAVRHHRAGRLAEAEGACRKILALDPGNADCLRLLSAIALSRGGAPEAVELLERALALRPEHAETLGDLGLALMQSGRLQDAMARCEHAIALDPGSAEARNTLGTVLRRLDRPAEAILQYEAALALRPGHVEAHNNLGNALRTVGRLPEAAEHYRRVLALRPDIPETLTNLGLVLYQLDDAEEAVACHRRAVALRPGLAEAHNNLGLALQRLGRVEEALACHRRAVALRPDYADAHLNLGIAALALGDWATGWGEYEWRYRTAQIPPRDLGRPAWDGAPLGDRVLLLHAEQGFGDAIQLCRYAPLVAAVGKVVLEVPRPLAVLLSELPGVERVAVRGESLPPFDVECALPSLPHRLGTTSGSVPAAIPYLRARPLRAAAWRRRLAALPGLKVGLCWAGSPDAAPGAGTDRRRSLPLARLAPLAAVPGVTFVSLQKGAAAAEGRTPPDGLALQDWTDELRDFADTAALVAGLDLVISVDTAVAHLAGALGRPVWLLDRFDACWRWLRGREDSPWYPTLRIFRQPADGDWDAVVARAAAALAALPQAAPGPDAPEAAPAADLVAMLQAGFAHHQAGRTVEAAALYGDMLAVDPAHPEALHLSGVIALQDGQLDEAVRLIERALAGAPDHAEAHNNLGVALQRRGELDKAILHWEKAAALKPDYAAAYDNLGRALLEQDRPALALACYERAVAVDPGSAALRASSAGILNRLGRHDEAAAHFERALAIRPDDAGLHAAFGAALSSQGRHADAAERFERALALQPGLADAHLGLAALRELQCRPEAATAHLEQVLAAEPARADLRLRACMTQLPILYEDEAEVTARRAAYAERLRRLCDDFDAGRVAGDLAAAVGSHQPFFLPYQGEPDRELQSLLGRLACRAVARRHPAAVLAPPPAAGERVRVGIVSGLFRHHTVWKLMIKGWLTQLDRERFAVFGYHTGDLRDEQTRLAAALCERFVQGPLPQERWREEILADRPHVLLYPEIGMDPGAAWIAANRLAPVQCVSWGHPNTTGYPTIDYVLSSELMEPANGDGHYTERLVRLPNLSIYYEPLDVAPAPLDRAGLGLRPEATAYWCGQSLFKYLPRYDEVFARIARDAGDCQFAFIGSMHGDEVTARMQRRLERAFAAEGLEAQAHCVFLPRLDLPQFVGAIGQCDVVLDSLGWSGGNTTLEGLAVDVPVVTMPGPLMRGRHSAAILRLMGVEETVADSVDAYVAIAVRLARDPGWRAALRRRMAEGKHRVYRDRTAIAALEDFLERAARPPAAARPAAVGLAAPRRATAATRPHRAANAAAPAAAAAS